MKDLSNYEVKIGQGLLNLTQQVAKLRKEYKNVEGFTPVGALSEESILQGIRKLINLKKDKQVVGDKLLSLGAGCVSKLEPEHYPEFIQFLIDLD